MGTIMHSRSGGGGVDVGGDSNHICKVATSLIPSMGAPIGGWVFHPRLR